MTVNESNSQYGNQESVSLDSAWRIHSALTDWTGKVDTKASFALTLESAVLIAVLTLSAQGRALDRVHGLRYILLCGGVIATILAVIAALSVVIPRLRRSIVKDEWRNNFIYFGHVRMWTSEDLTAALRNVDILPVLANQIVNMGKIAWRKHVSLQASLILAVVGISLLAVTVATA